jgi:hypothetical protein
VLVVSNIDLTDKLQAMKPSEFLDSSTKGFTLNINNEYRYLKAGYYVSLHAEVLGNRVIPSSENIIDSSRTPILLLRAARAGISTLPFIVTDSVKKIVSEVGLPVVLFAVNPFIYNGYEIAKNKSALYRAMKSLGMNYKFDVCAMPLKGEMISVKTFFGKAQIEDTEINAISNKVYELFKIPVCKLHLQKVDGKAYLSGLQPIKENELQMCDLELISKEIMLISQQGEHVSV